MSYSLATQRTHREELIAALRSGSYKQGMQALRTGGRGGAHCCLGVGADLCGLGKWVGADGTPGGGEGNKDAYQIRPVESTSPLEAERNYLTPSVRDYYGFTACNPELDNPVPVDLDYRQESAAPERTGISYHKTLGALNDAGAGFEQIANLIEAGCVLTVS